MVVEAEDAVIDLDADDNDDNNDDADGNDLQLVQNINGDNLKPELEHKDSGKEINLDRARGLWFYHQSGQK